MAMSSGKQAGSRGRRLWRYWPVAACVLLLAAFLWPMRGAPNPRFYAAQKALAHEKDPTRRIILEFQKAYAVSRDGRTSDPDELKRLWAGMDSFQGPHPEFFWMALCLLEARSGDLPAAQKALQRARAIDPGIVFLARGPAWARWLQELGLAKP